MTLALGIGAAGTIFTIFDGMFLKGLPVDKPDRIVSVGAIIVRVDRYNCRHRSSDDWRTANKKFNRSPPTPEPPQSSMTTLTLPNICQPSYLSPARSPWSASVLSSAGRSLPTTTSVGHRR